MKNKILKLGMQLSLNLEIFIAKEDQYFVAYSPALELSAYADTPEKAKIAFEKEVDIFLQETNRRGTLEKYLLKNGWKLQQVPEPKYEPPKADTNKLLGSFKSADTKRFNQTVSIPV